MTRILTLVLLAFSMGILSQTPATADDKTTKQARKFVESFTEEFRPLEIAAGLAWWDANNTGKDADFKRREKTQNRIDAFLADSKAFAKVKKLKESGKIDDPIVKRAIDLIYLQYLEKQVDPDLLKQMSKLNSSLEKKFSVYRAKVGGKELTAGDVSKILKSSKLSARRKAVWESSKAVGKVVEKELLQLVRLRNKAARKLGFKNYHELKLYLNEQNGKDLIALFDRLDKLTREPFRKAKAEIDAKLARDCGVEVDALMPWHYHDPFFQEVPNVFETDIDKIYAKVPIVKLCREFYDDIGLPIDLVIKKSGNDFLPRKGKNPHAFCIDITRDGKDVRVLANIVPSERWMSTMLHEFGHSVYSSIYIPQSLPYILRQDAHILCTEGVAMMFEKLSKDRAWLEKMGVTVKDKKAFDITASKMKRYQLLIFSRWCQVMLRFEKAMYENPDQDLNKLWWDLVEKYQLLKRPPNRDEPDYGSKIHIIVAPVYYHNYMMGQMFASQLHHAIAREVYKDDPKDVVYIGNPKVGEFMQKKVFDPGRSLNWNDLTKYATGSFLKPDAFAKDFGG